MAAECHTSLRYILIWPPGDVGSKRKRKGLSDEDSSSEGSSDEMHEQPNKSSDASTRRVGLRQRASVSYKEPKYETDESSGEDCEHAAGAEIVAGSGGEVPDALPNMDDCHVLIGDFYACAVVGIGID